MARFLALISTITLSLSFASAFGGEMYVVHKFSTDSYKKDKKDGETETRATTQWFAGDKLRSNDGDESILMRLDKDTIYTLDNKKQTYTAIQASTFGLPATGQAGDEQVPAMVSSMMGSMFKMEVTIEPTSETKKIGQWNCTKYNQTVQMMGVTTSSELWATEDVVIDKKLLDKFFASQFMTKPGMQDFAVKMQKEAEKIKGCVVYSKSTTTMGTKRTETIDQVTEIKEQAAPQDTWVVPAKYKLKKAE
ncbi:MAG TPA: hypothetical protein VHO70_13195 [Chitinispirillaceae bacterium]|nr:hypothetical protein [Chitinispirillaceae bacterium]